MIDLNHPPAKLFATSVCVLLSVMALRVLEAQWPPLAMWVFVLLSLTLGFGHGALDAVLLLGQFAPRKKAMAVSVAYLLCVLLAGWVLSWSVPGALLLLVLMSVWHFGELHSYALWARLCVGGASVMWPVLVAQDAMATLVLGTLGSNFSAVWGLWIVLAKYWFILVLVYALTGVALWFLHRKKAFLRADNLPTNEHRQTVWAAIEIVALLFAYLVFSPLLAFALYFGVYHSLAHMARVRRAVLARTDFVFLKYAKAFIASVLVTALLLALSWWFLPSLPWLGDSNGKGFANAGQILQWLIVSLAAVTLPHLVLVSYSACWLER